MAGKPSAEVPNAKFGGSEDDRGAGFSGEYGTALEQREESGAGGVKVSVAPPAGAEESLFGGIATPYGRQGQERTDDFSRSLQRPELALALKFSRDPAQTVEKWRLQGLLAEETKMPVSVMNGLIFDSMKSAVARQYFGLAPGVEISNGELADKIEAINKAQERMREKDPRFVTKAELYEEVRARAPRGWEGAFEVLAASEMANFPTPDDPIVPLRPDPANGREREAYCVWDPYAPLGNPVFHDFELADKHAKEVRDRLNGVKPKERRPAVHYEWPSSPEARGELGEILRGPEEMPESPPKPGWWSGLADMFHTARKVEIDGGLRFSRGAVGWGFDVKTGINLWMREWAKQFSNPYVFKTVEEAKADLKRIDARIEALAVENEKNPRRRISEYTAEDLARLKEMDELKGQRFVAERASRGLAEDSTVGALYSVAKEELEWNREARKKVLEAYSGVINPEYDDWIAMQAVEGLGGSAVDLIGTAVLIPLGATTTFLRNQGAAYEEYVKNAAERGWDTSEQAEMAYSLKQAGTASAIETASNVTQVGMVGRLAGRGSWLRKGLTAGVGTGVDLAAGAGQTMAEQRVAEEHGVRDRMSMEELNAQLAGEAEVGLATNAILAALGLGAGSARRLLGGEEPDGRTHFSKTEGDGSEVEGSGKPWVTSDTSGVGSAEGVVEPEQLGQAAFELANDDSAFRLGPTPRAKDLPTILRTLAPQLAENITVSEGAGWHGEGYTITDSKGGEIFLTTHPKGGYRVDSSHARTDGTLVYQAIYAWAHNNSVQIHEDLGMTDLGTYRRNAQMISSILRFGTSRHLTVGPASGLEARWIRNDGSRAAAEYNLGLLLHREKELVFQRLPELAKMRYNLEENSFYDGEHRIPNEEVEAYFRTRIAQLGGEVSGRVGHSTARRALAVAAAEEGGPGWREWLVGDTAGALRPFKGVFYSKDAGRAGSPVGGEAFRAGEEPAGVSGEAGRGGSGQRLSPGEHAAQVRGWTEEIRTGWGSQLDVVVHDSAEGIADARLRDAVADGGDGVEAFFDPTDGRIHLLADRVGSKADAERLIRHEGIHWAVNGKLKDEYESILEGVRKRISKEEWESLRDDYPERSDRVLVEEYLAYLGQNNPKAGAWRSFVYEFKQAMKRLFGRDFELTDADVLALLAKANRKVERREGDPQSGTANHAIGQPETPNLSEPSDATSVDESQKDDGTRNTEGRGIDEDRQKAYEDVISEAYAALPEYLAGQSRSFGEAAEAAEYRGSAESGEASSERSIGRKLAGWAERKGRLVSVKEIEALSSVSDYTSEHTVYYRPEDDRIVKVTKDLYYGEIPIVEGGVLTSRGATPVEYLRRMELQTAVFHSDVKLEGVHVPVESALLDDPAEAPRIVISQPFYEQVGRVTLEQVNNFLREAGFEKVPDSFYGWIRRSDGVVIQDAATDNFILTEAGLYPFDLQINIVSPAILKDLKTSGE